ncbi:unnamed protein product [Pylaiella littoralis]
MDSETIDATVTTTVESPTPAEVDTGVLAAAADDDAADAELAKLLDDGDDIAASTAGGGLGVGEQGSGRLSSLVPTLGRFATRAHKASAPYLSYAAQASQEAARFTAGHAKRYVNKVHAQHRRGEAPPGQIDSAKVDWSGVGARFCSLSWYDRQLIENSKSDGGDEGPLTSCAEGEDVEEEVAGASALGASSLSPPLRLYGSGGVGFGVRARPAQACVMATLKELDPWVTAPLFEDECNSMDPISAMVSGRPPFPVVGVDSSGTGLMDCPSPPSGRPGDGPLDGLCESWEEGEEETTGVTAGAFSFAPVGTASLQAFRQTFDDLGGGGAGIQGEMPEAARVGGFIPSVEREYLSASAPAAVSSSPFGLPQAHATATASAVNVQQAPEDTTALSAEDVPRPAFATPPPVPPKRTGGTTAFVVKERSAAAAAATDPLALLYDVSGEADAAATVTPGAVSSQDLLLEWLRREAGHGDEEAQFHLAQLFSPPRFEMKPECRDCGEPFGVTRYRHHCRHCGGSFCHEHAWHEHPIPKLGLPAAQRVCTPCKHTLELEDWRERVEWRLERVNAYLEERLIPYFDTGVDTVGDKALRVVDGAIYVAKSAPLGTAVKVSVEVMDVLMKYGTAGVAGLVLRREFVEAVEVLKRLSGVDKKWPMSVHEMTAAMYYLLAQRRGERGSAPNAEHEVHADCDAVSDDELLFLRRMSALPLHFAYTKTALELQVLCNTTGWSLVFHKPDSRFHQPAFSLLACRTTMTAALVVRGTGSIQDVITDIQAMPVPFPAPRADGASGAEADGWSDLPPTETVACSGMARAAEWLHREVVHQLIKLRREGNNIVILGHSLGGGVAALLGVLLKDAIPDVRVVGFATPACADIGVSKLCEGLCTSVILHDDVVPRVTPHAVRALLKDLLCTKEGWVKHLYNDWDAVVGRAKGLWAPRWRTALVDATPTTAAITDGSTDADPATAVVGGDGLIATEAVAAAAAAAEMGFDEKLRAAAREGVESAPGGKDGSSSSGVNLVGGDGEHGWGGRGSPAEVVVEKIASGGAAAGVTASTAGAGEEAMVVEVRSEAGVGKGRWSKGAWSAVDVRSVQSRLSRMVDDTSARIRSNMVKDTESAAPPPPPRPPLPPRPAGLGPSYNAPNTAATKAGAGSDDAAGALVAEKVKGGRGDSVDGPSGGGGGSSSGLGSEEEAEVVEEFPLPELYVPGRIVHIYSQRGVYRATEVPRDHDTLRTIPMYGNMLADHASLAYFDALEEIAAVRAAEAKGEFMPDWVPFSESEVCQLCKADFSWASTSKSEAQRARDKHNCRMCGILVCDPCSNHRKPLPRVGVLEACRVCDRCFYGADPSRA